MKQKKANLNCNLVASWTVEVGDLDQCLHLWKYTGGFEKIDQAKADLWHDPVIVNCTLKDFFISLISFLGFSSSKGVSWLDERSCKILKITAFAVPFSF